LMPELQIMGIARSGSFKHSGNQRKEETEMIAGQGKFTRTFRAATLAFGMAFVAGSASAETTLEKIQDQGYINIAFANERPFSYAEPNGELAGVEVELLTHIMKELGIPEIQ